MTAAACRAGRGTRWLREDDPMILVCGEALIDLFVEAGYPAAERDALLALDADTLRAILSEAVAPASLTCTRLGADLPTRTDLLSVLA